MPTKIEWVRNPDGSRGETWNPVRGCSRVAEGCRNCYAERIAARFCGGEDSMGQDGAAPFRDFAMLTPSGPRWTGRVELIPEKLDEPLRRRKPTTYFVNSMSDLFHERLSDADIDRVLAVMALCPRHRFIVLTKRAERMEKHLLSLEAIAADWQARLVAKGAKRDGGMPFNASSVLNIKWLKAGMGRAFPDSRWPLPNLILGVSASTQSDLDEQAGHLLRTPAACRMLSLEPLIEGVNVGRYLTEEVCHCGIQYSQHKEHHGFTPMQMPPEYLGIDWIVIGGESGPGARPCDVEWIRSVIRQCKDAGVPCFVKQLGARPVGESWPDGTRITDAGNGLTEWGAVLKSREGSDLSEWPEDLKIRQFPEALHG